MVRTADCPTDQRVEVYLMRSNFRNGTEGHFSLKGNRIMKKNAILIAGILCVASASRAQEDASDRYKSGQYDVSSEAASSGEDDISADSSKRGGSLDARGYDQAANNDEVEGAPDPINPG